MNPQVSLRRPSFVSLLSVVLALVSGPIPVLPPVSAGFVQDRFAIGLWVPPRPADPTELPARYRELAEAGFNLVIANSVSDPAAQVRLCREAGLKALVEVSGPASGFVEDDGCWGYHLADEPGVSAFAGLATRVEEIRRERPGRLAFINLFPNYASPAQLGCPTYEEHVARFLEVVRPEVLCMDHYPVMRPDKDTRSAYLDNLETFRRHAEKAGIPFWNFFNIMPYGPHTDPTEAQVRWQVHASIAHGAKGVLYFCYWTPGKGAGGSGEFPKGGAILTAEGLRTRHYEEARRINAGLHKWGPTLMELAGEGVSRMRVTSRAAEPAGCPGLSRVAVQPGDAPCEFLVGRLRHRDGRRALLLVNHDLTFTAWPTLEFESGAAGVQELDRNTGLPVTPLDASPELPGFQCPLAPGDARLFLLPSTAGNRP